MNKKTAVILMTMAMASVPAGAFAAATDVTAEQLLADAAVYFMDAPGVDGTMGFKMEGSMAVSSEDSPETSMGLSVKGNLDVKKAADPLKMAMTGDVTIGFFGQSIPTTMEMYMIQDGEDVDVYHLENSQGNQDGTWRHERKELDDVWEGWEPDERAEFKEEFLEELAEARIKLNWDIQDTGKTYDVTGQLTYDDLLPLIAEIEDDDDADREELEMAKKLLKALKVNISASFDKETHGLLKAHIDLADTDLAALNQELADILAESMDMGTGASTKITFDLKDSSFDTEYSYDSVPEITVPDEALQTPADRNDAWDDDWDDDWDEEEDDD